MAYTRTRDFWIYQKRLCPDMWALHIVVDTDSRKSPMRTFDVCMYADFIPKAAHSDSRLYRKCYAGPEEFADDIGMLCRAYGQEFTDDDYDQCIKEFIGILMDA